MKEFMKNCTFSGKNSRGSKVISKFASFVWFTIAAVTETESATSTGINILASTGSYPVVINGPFDEGASLEISMPGRCQLRFFVMENSLLHVFDGLGGWCLTVDSNKLVLTKSCGVPRIYLFQNMHIVDALTGKCAVLKDHVLVMRPCDSNYMSYMVPASCFLDHAFNPSTLLAPSRSSHAESKTYPTIHPSLSSDFSSTQTTTGLSSSSNFELSSYEVTSSSSLAAKSSIASSSIISDSDSILSSTQPDTSILQSPKSTIYASIHTQAATVLSSSSTFQISSYEVTPSSLLATTSSIAGSSIISDSDIILSSTQPDTILLQPFESATHINTHPSLSSDFSSTQATTVLSSSSNFKISSYDLVSNSSLAAKSSVASSSTAMSSSIILSSTEADTSILQPSPRSSLETTSQTPQLQLSPASSNTVYEESSSKASSVYQLASSDFVSTSAYQELFPIIPNTIIQSDQTTSQDSAYEIIHAGPAIDGAFGSWTAWSNCSEPCGPGSQVRRRYCDSPFPTNGGVHCVGVTEESIACNQQSCPGLKLALPGHNCEVTCLLKGFKCSSSISTGDSKESFLDMGIPCNDNDSIRIWSDPCHPFVDVQTLTCSGYMLVPSFVNCSCQPDIRQQRVCNCVEPADIDFTEWTPWLSCSVSCGGGRQIRTRRCININSCSGPSEDSRICNEMFCAVHGGFTEWSHWSQCDVSCDGGLSKRNRSCSNPYPAYGGLMCYGAFRQQIACGIQNCPVHGGWTAWTQWTSGCDKPCNYGNQWRWRFCSNPLPLYGGDDCTGRGNVSSPCNLFPCQAASIQAIVPFDMSWSQGLATNGSEDYAEFQSNLLYNLQLLYGGKLNDSFKEATTINLWNGSIVAHFSMTFQRLDSYQLVYFQEGIETEHQIGDWIVKKSNYTLYAEQVPDTPPLIINAISSSPTSISISWSPVLLHDSTEELTGYIVFYRETGHSIGSFFAIGANDISIHINGLNPNTLYGVRVSASNSYGNGIASGAVYVKTRPAVPSSNPASITAYAISPTEAFVEWTEINLSEMRGNAPEYKVTYSDRRSPSLAVIVPFTKNFLAIYNLEPFTEYHVDVQGINEVGFGPITRTTFTTLNTGPTEAPHNFTAFSLDSDSWIKVTWKRIPVNKINGDLLYYKISYNLLETAGKEQYQANTEEVIVHPRLTVVSLEHLRPNSKYEIYIQAVNQHGDSVKSASVVAETCKCPPVIHTSYTESKPYIYRNQNGDLIGVFSHLLLKMIHTACGTCGNPANWTQIDYIRNGKLSWASQRSTTDVIESIDDFKQLSFPLNGKIEMERYMGYAFVPVLPHPGIAVIVINEALSERVGRMLSSVAAVWPVLTICVLLITLSGTIMWTLEGRKNSELEGNSIIRGIPAGIYWAFVTMGTLGYGDITPKTMIGRIFAMTWILVSLVCMSILTGALTSSLTVVNNEGNFKIYGAKVGALEQSKEYSVAVIRNGRVNEERKYTAVEDLARALKEREIKAVLLDVYTAAARWPLFTSPDIRIYSVIRYSAAYGVVLSGRLKYAENHFRSFVKENAVEIENAIANFTVKLKSVGTTPKPISLFDKDSSFLRQLIASGAGLLAFIIVVASIWTLIKMCRQRNDNENKASEHANTKADGTVLSEQLLKLRMKLDKKLKQLDKQHVSVRLKLGLYKRPKTLPIGLRAKRKEKPC